MEKTTQYTLTYYASDICVSVKETITYNIDGELIQKRPTGYSIYPEHAEKIAALPDVERQQVIDHFANNPVRVAARVAKILSQRTKDAAPENEAD